MEEIKLGVVRQAGLHRFSDSFLFFFFFSYFCLFFNPKPVEG